MGSKPENQHPDDIAVDALAEAMKAKLRQKREEGRGGWEHTHPAILSQMLIEHVNKRDPLDVANFCMMLFNQSAPITANGVFMPAVPAAEHYHAFADGLNAPTPKNSGNFEVAYGNMLDVERKKLHPGAKKLVG